jgi:tetratricopeptide (TPR) repeat protein
MPLFKQSSATQQKTKQLSALLLVLSLIGCASTQDNIIQPESPHTETKIEPFSDDSLYALLEAEFSGHRGHFTQASDIYRQQALALDDTELLSRATKLALFNEENAAAEELAYRWLQKQPTDQTAKQLYASSLLQQGKLDLALTQMLALYSKGHQQNFILLAAEAAETYPAQVPKLIAPVAKASVDYPDEIQFLLALGILQTTIDSKLAISTIVKAQQLDPSSVHAVSIEAKILQQNGQIDDARKRLKQSIGDGTKSFALRVQYARLLAQEDIIAGRLYLIELHEEQPRNVDTLYSLALINKQLKLWGDAEGNFQQLVELHAHTNESHYYLGLLAQRTGDMDTAAIHYQQVGLGEKYLFAVSRLNEMWQTELPKLQNYMAQQRSLYPSEKTDLYLIETETLLIEKNYALAHQLLTQGIIESPNNNTLRYSRSLVSDKRADIKLIEEDLRAILEDRPEHAATLNALGYSLTNYTTRYDEALTLIRKALKNKPGDPAILDSLGWTYYQQGNVKTALIYLIEAYKRQPDPEIAAHLGEALWSQNQKQKALQIWQQALASYPDHELIISTMTRLNVITSR